MTCSGTGLAYKVGAVSKDDVREALVGWQSALGLSADPGPGVKDLKGRSVRIVVFDDEESTRFYFPRRSLLFHQMMVQVLTRALRRRGAKIDRVTLTAEDYARWCDRTGTEDLPEVRYRFASAPPEL
jgi:hypothetical protein